MRVFLLAAAAAAITACQTAPERDDITAGGFVAAADPRAVDAGLEVLREGGSAVDAAIAVQAVLSLVEPQSSGLGGGALMMFYDADAGEIVAYEGRETAPAGATPDLFLKPDGTPMDFLSAKNSGLSVGVPGVVAMLKMAHEEQGVLPWGAQFDAAIEYSEEGFEVSPRLAYLIDRFADYGLRQTPDTRAYFYDADGNPHPAGHVIKNPEYAETLRAISEDWRDFYEGDIARAIADRVHYAAVPGSMTLEDLASYQAHKKEPICVDYRAHEVCGAPPPLSGGATVGQILEILERVGFAEGGADNPQNWHRFAEAERLAYADRDRYAGDDAFVDYPIAGLLDAAYVDERAAIVDPERAQETITFGFPPGCCDPAPGADGTPDSAGTSHFVVMDGDGNVVSMTTTVESFFGSLLMAGGMFLNNELTDFSFTPVDADGEPAANAVAPGKRPRSSMSPSIVLDADGDFYFATGSPGGNAIIGYTAKSLIGVLDWGLTPQEAADLPNIVARFDKITIEEGRASDELVAALRALGHTVETSEMTSGIHSLLIAEDGLVGAADPRREGTYGVLEGN
jgi:gamma-glutamyltranspeptidase/glutathione hydrolase